MKQNNESEDLKELKIEDTLPVKAVGVECLKESIPTTMSPHRYLFKWFARRPTAATRLAVLASVLPANVTNDELLSLMKIGPKRPELLKTSISEYVLERRAEWGESDESLVEHYGYPLPHSVSPSQDEIHDLHEKLRDHWDGDLPTVLDPTSGSGTIPMEAYRYGLPVKANELNSVAWLLNKVVLEYAAKVGSLEKEVKKWSEKIDKKATEELAPFFNSEQDNRQPSYYLCAYSIECPSCGMRLPMSNRWWFHQKSSSKGHAFRPHPKKDKIEYEYVELPHDVTKDEFDPSKGTVDGGDAECLSCGVVTELNEVRNIFQKGNFEFEIVGIKYEGDGNGDDGFRAPTQEDQEAFDKAAEAVVSNLRYSTLLNTDIKKGKETSKLFNYDYRQWRDIYTPRQLLSFAKYLEAYEVYKDKIQAEYPEKKAEAILSILSMSATKMVERNTRLEPMDIRLGSPANMLGSNNFTHKWHYCETNLTIGSYSYSSSVDLVLRKYEEISENYSLSELPDCEITKGDGADMPYPDKSVDAVVIDPPYGDNVMYGELADSLYVWLREYLQDVHSREFAEPITNKEDEAVENTSNFSEEDVQANESANSRGDLAKRFYEDKMSEIFQDSYRVLDRGGVLTVYFTDRDTGAWDSLTMSMINAGFTITATHTITSEMPHRVGMQERTSADSSLLLTCRRPTSERESEQREPTLWSDIKEKTEQVAINKANELLDSELNLTKTDTIISAFGPTLRVFTENYPVVDIHDKPVRPAEALEAARAAVTRVLIDRELHEGLDIVDDLSTWYILMFLVYNHDTVPYDEANQLGLGLGVHIDELKRPTKIWKKSGNNLIVASESDRVRDFAALEQGEKRRKRAYPVDPRESKFDYTIDAVHACLNVLGQKGSDFTWNWIKDRGLETNEEFIRTIESLLQVLPENHPDYNKLVNVASGETGQLLDIDVDVFSDSSAGDSDNKTTLQDF